MTQEGRMTLTDRQARIRAVRNKRALFKLVLLIALLAIFGVVYKLLLQRWNSVEPPAYLSQMMAQKPIHRDPEFDSTTASLTPGPAQPVVASANPEQNPGHTNSIVPPPSPKVYPDDGWARNQLQVAEASYRDLDFAAGASLVDPILAKQINADLRKQAEDLRRRCQEYPLAIDHIQPLKLAAADNPMQLWAVTIGEGDYIFDIPKGQESGVLVGDAILRDRPVAAGSMQLSFDPNENNVIANKISRNDLLDIFRQYFHKVEASSGLINSPNTCYDLVFLARKMSLQPETLKYLELADKLCLAAGARIDDVFRDRCIALALDQAVFYDNLNQRGPAEHILKDMVASLKDYPKAEQEADGLRAMWKKFGGRKMTTVHLVKDPVASAPPPKPADTDDGGLTVGPVKITTQDGHSTNVPATDNGSKTPAADSQPIGMSAASAARGGEDIAFDDLSKGAAGAKDLDKIQQADKLFRDGIDHMRKGTNMNGGADNQSEITKAADELGKAADLYQAAADSNQKSNPGLADQLTARSGEAGEYAYGMEKRSTLDFYSSYKRR
ncbi:MAG: hypothetical protein ACREJ2_03460 [Planctomycetota bacterium]